MPLHLPVLGRWLRGSAIGADKSGLPDGRLTFLRYLQSPQPTYPPTSRPEGRPNRPPSSR